MPRAAVVLVLLCACRPHAQRPAPLPAPAPDGRPPLNKPGPLAPRIASYAIRAELDPAAHRITATETLRWRHTGVAPVASVPLHLYMNAFKDETTLFMRETGGRLRGLTARTDAGWIEVESIVAGGVELRPGARFGADATTLDVPLPRPLAPGAELVLELRFTTQLPMAFARTGWTGAFHMVGQWFPKIGVLSIEGRGQRWHCDPFHGDSEFFADFGVYDVELTVPTTHRVAAAGVLVGADELGDGRRRLRYRAEDVHDFAWMADPFMKVETARAGAVEIRLYHRPGHEAYVARHLEAARRTLETFGRLFGPYPYAILTLVDPPWDAALATGGMEYPTLVTTGGDADLPGTHFAEIVTVHEVGHQWFQGLLASNEVDEAFLDEGVNEYANGLVLDDWFGADRSFLDLPGAHVGYVEEHRIGHDPRRLVTPIATPSYLFAPGEYASATYSKMMLVLSTLEALAGRAEVVAALGRYARANRFRHPTRRDLVAALGPEWRGFLDPALLGPGGVDYRIQSIGDDAFTVENLGPVPAPAEVAVRLRDGQIRRERWDGAVGFRTFAVAAPIAEVEIDPDGKVLLEHDRLDDGWAELDLAAPARAAARVGFWEQTLEALVGL
jgi:hypothetical protein